MTLERQYWLAYMLQRLTQMLRAGALAALGGALVSACGGGGGDPPNPPPPLSPTVSLQASPSAIASGESTTLTWTATNATACVAALGWSGSKSTSGSEAIGPLTANTSFELTCTGSGGSTTQTAAVTIVPPPTVSLTAQPAAVTVNHTATLTWSSTDATACVASDGWSGAKAAAGAESTAPLTADTTFTLTCTGVGGTDTVAAAVTVAPPGPGMVVVSGRITFDRVPFKTAPFAGLNPNAPDVSPARHVLVEGVDANTQATLGSATTTDLNGHYALIVPVSISMLVRVRAHMRKTGAAPNWDFSVRNNTNSDALYVLESSNQFNSGTMNRTHDLHAPSGWGGTSYTGTRAAAPFAILDTAFRAKQLILAAGPDTVFEPLNLFWSSDNRPAVPFCPRDGNIVTSSYVVFGANGVDGCQQPGIDGIYILGDFAGGNGDTDEFDQHVIAHEFGHYVEDKFSRSDSIGGSHGGGDRLDLRVAFGEGWGNAYSGMALQDPAYRDSQAGADDEFGFSLEADGSVAQGWFSEPSVGEILWDIFDGGAEPGDTVALGFGPIYAAMTAAQVTTEALTSIFPFARAIRSANPSASAAIGTLLSGESISGTDDFASGESNSGTDSTVLPIYQDIARNTPLAGICSRSTAGSSDTNKLGNRRFLRFVNDAARLLTISATGAAPNAQSVAATDPDIFVFQRGSLVVFGTGSAPGTEMIPQFSLPAGTYVIEVYDANLTGTNAPPRCMTVSITG